MLVLPSPDAVPRALDATDEAQQDEAKVTYETVTDGAPDASPYRPPYVQLNQNNYKINSPGLLSAHGSISNTDRNQTYRILPIIAGVLVPLMVLLSIPSLTNHWYVRTDGGNVTLEARPSPPLLVAAMSVSMTCGVLANFFLVLRFAERSVKKMTVLCIVLLLLNELINIPAVIIFAVTHRFEDGFIYGQSFWMTVCSMVFSVTTNITLIIDYGHTKDFANSGSGLTHKQRSLVIMIIVLLCYITFGSLVQTFLLKITFIDALYFTVVSIETIGFGDIHPTSTGTRIFISLYIAGGILNLALAVLLSREALLEAAAAGFHERVKMLRALQRERHIRERWKAAVKWRLQAKNLPLWVANNPVVQPWHHRNHWWKSVKHACSLPLKKISRVSESLPCYTPSDKHLNLNALTEAQLEAAALEAGAPLADLLFSTTETPANDAGNVEVQPQPLLTHMRIGGMVSLLGQFAVAFTHGHSDADSQTATNHNDSEDSTHDGKPVREIPRVPFTRTLTLQDEKPVRDIPGVPFTRTLTLQDEKPVRERLGVPFMRTLTLPEEKPVRERQGVPFTRTFTLQDEESFQEILQAEERFAFFARLSIACLFFLVFWMVGSVIFMTTEGWNFGTAVYFCFVAFSTVGYGDFAPKTQAGRSIFVVWSILGVATMTILISILTEAYSKTYKSAIKTEMITAKSPTEDASMALMRQRFFDSRTVVNAQEFSPYLPQSPTSQYLQSPFSQFPQSPISQSRNSSFPSSRNDHTRNMSGVPLSRKVRCHLQKPSLEDMTAFSLEILRHSEKLQSLLNSVDDSEILEVDVYTDQVERTIQDIFVAAKDGLGTVDSMV